MVTHLEPFFSTKEVGKGTGLGLLDGSTASSSRRGGYIFADSEVWQGHITFRIYLPRHIVEADDEIVSRREKKKEATAGPHWLEAACWLEDEDVVRSFAARALARQGYEVL